MSRIYSNKKQEQNVDFMKEHINITMHHSPVKSYQKSRFRDGAYYIQRFISLLKACRNADFMT